MDVKARIKQYCCKVISEEIGDEDDIFALGFVDSLFAIQLVQFVENEFSITTEREDLDINNFCSIAAVTSFVCKKLDQKTELRFEHGRPIE